MASYAATPRAEARAVRTASNECARLGDARVEYRSAPPAAASARGIALRDVTSTWGLEDPLAGMLVHAAAAADVDADGWTDLFVGTFADRPRDTYEVRGASGPSPDRLLLGGPNGFHVDPTFPGRRGRTSGAAFADLDGDGAPELIIARNVRDVPNGRTGSEILRNVDGHLVPAFALDAPGGARSIGLLDADQDGRIDLLVTEDRWSGSSSRLYRNDGRLRFTDVTTASGLPERLVGMGAATADLNGDGAPDLFVGGSNRIFLNDGSGNFREGDSKVFRWKTFGPEDDPAGVAVGDLDGDGRPDLVVGQHYGSTIDLDQRVPVRLYLNERVTAGGDPVFRDVTSAAGLVGLPTRSPHVELADLDADGHLDIVASASVDQQTPVVFHNIGVRNGIPRFEVGGTPGPAQYWPTGVVFDADHDGRPDVFLGEFDAGKPSLMLRNVSDSEHWIGVGAPVGAVVSVFAPSSAPGGRRLLGRSTIGSSTGFGAGEPPVARFGTGELARVDVTITVGQAESRLSQVPADREVTLSCAG